MNEINRIKKNYFSTKVSVIGDIGAGKSVLLKRWTENQFSDQEDPTIGHEFFSKIYSVKDNKLLKLDVCDFSGKDYDCTGILKDILQVNFKSSYAFILCVDLSKEDTFDRVSTWIHYTRQATHEDIPILVVGTKSDLLAQDTMGYRKKLLENKAYDEHCLACFITSAKQDDALTLDNIFMPIVNLCEPKLNNVVDENKPKQKDKSLWHRHKRKFIAGIIIGVLVTAAITLGLALPIVPFLLASIGLIKPLTGIASTLAVAGISGAIGLAVGTVITGIGLGLEKCLRWIFKKKPSHPSKVIQESLHNQQDGERVPDSVLNDSSNLFLKMQSAQIEISFSLPTKAIPLAKTLEIAKEFGEKIMSGELNIPREGETYHADLIKLVSQFKNSGIYKDSSEPVSDTNYNKTDLMNDFVFFIAPYLTDKQLHEFTSALFKLELSTAAEGSPFRNATLAKSFLTYETARNLQKIPADVLTDESRLQNYIPLNIEAHLAQHWEIIRSIPSIHIPLQKRDFAKANQNLREFIHFNMINPVVQDGLDNRQGLLTILCKDKSTIDVIDHFTHYQPTAYLASLTDENADQNLILFTEEIDKFTKENNSAASDEKSFQAFVNSKKKEGLSTETDVKLSSNHSFFDLTKREENNQVVTPNHYHRIK